jgi:nucleotide-binding universal stress UspA family protein
MQRTERLTSLTVRPGVTSRQPESVTVNAAHGVPVEELVNVSNEAGMVVLGSRGAGGFTGMLPSSTAGQVGQHAYGPVVIVRRRTAG